MKPKILILDIETAPMEVYSWDLRNDGYTPVNMVKKDWYMMSWAAKWLDKKKVYQADQRNGKNLSDDFLITLRIHALINEADIIVTQNGKKFDAPRLNERFLVHGLRPPKSYRHIDVRNLFRSHFKFPSNSLEYLSRKLCRKYKKLTHKKFPGFELWKECLAGNKDAWREMAKYNIHDVLTLEELFKLVIPYANPINMAVYYRNPINAICSCGGKVWVRNGFIYTSSGKYQRWECKKCGAELRSKKNMIKTGFARVAK